MGLVTILGFLFLSLSTVGHFHSVFVHFLYSPCFLTLLFLGKHCTEGVPSEVISTGLSSLYHTQFIYPLSLDTPGKALLKNWPSGLGWQCVLPGCHVFSSFSASFSSLHCPFNHYLEVINLCSTWRQPQYLLGCLSLWLQRSFILVTEFHISSSAFKIPIKYLNVLPFKFFLYSSNGTYLLDFSVQNLEDLPRYTSNIVLYWVSLEYIHLFPSLLPSI